MKLNINLYREIIEIIKRWKRLMSFIVALGVVLTVLFVAKLPSIYRSTVVFKIENLNVAHDIDDITFNKYAEQRIQEISRKIKSHVKLKTIISKYALYAKNGGLITANKMSLKKIRSDIEIRRINVDPGDPAIAGSNQDRIRFSISYNSSKPILAQSVTDELASLILNENLIALGDESPEYLRSEIDRVQKLMSRLQIELAQYKQENIESNSELIEMNQNLKENAQRNIDEVEERINNLTDKKSNISEKLSTISRDNNLSSTSKKTSGNLDVVERLKNLQLKADKLLNQNGELYPGLKLIRKEITALRLEMGEFDEIVELELQLEADRTELGNYQKRYDDGHPDIIRLIQKILTTEDAIDKLRAEKIMGIDENSQITSNKLENNKLNDQLEEANLEIGVLAESKRGYYSKLKSYEKNITQLSQFEDKFSEATKEYEGALKIVRELEEKQKQQNLSTLNIDESKNEKILLRELPQLPSNAVQPNRTALLILGALISFISSVFVVLLREKFDDSVKGSDDLMRAIGLETLGEISYIKTEPDIL